MNQLMAELDNELWAARQASESRRGMLACNRCGDKVHDPEQNNGGLHDRDSRCQHMDCEGTYKD